MKSIDFNGMQSHFPMSERFCRHTPEEFAAIREMARKHGCICVALRTYYDTTLALPNCVLDGKGRLTSAVELGLPPDKVPLYHEGRLTTEGAYDLALILNDARRHDVPEANGKLRAERDRRVAELRSQGLSTRAIAEQVGADQATVVRDLSRGDAPASPDGSPPSNHENAVGSQSRSPSKGHSNAM